MLRESGTLDELGIGQVRDAFSDLLFPGISTIQTRAKYFIIVPRIFRDFQSLPARAQKNRSLLDYLKEQEDQIAELLVQHHGSGETGIIGSTRIGKGGVARRPSSVYWNGLRQFELIHTNTSLSEFCRSKMSGTLASLSQDKDALGDEDDSDALESCQLVHVDRDYREWRENLSIDLTQSEAQFLILKIRHSAKLKDSVMAQILNQNLLADVLAVTNSNFSALEIWLLNQPKISDFCKERVHLASQFSQAIEGAHIRYNILVARNIQNEQLISERINEYNQWREQANVAKLFASGVHDKWLLAAGDGPKHRFKDRTVMFIERWCNAMLNNVPAEKLDKLVEQQAFDNKRERSLLAKRLPDNVGWVGMKSLDYRWGNARWILDDIYKGVTC